MVRGLVLTVVATSVPAIAWAQPKSADDYFKEGEGAYNVQDFDKAIDAFKKGYELEPDDSKKAAYLYNVGQAYRQKKDCANARFFYKRYLALKDNDTKKPLKPEKRREIETWITELEACAASQAVADRPPDPKTPIGPVIKTDDENKVGVQVPEPRGPMLSMRLGGGAAKVLAGDLELPVRVSAGMVAGYPLELGEQLTLELGGGFAYTRLSFEQPATMMKDSASTTALYANAAARLTVAPRIGLRGDVGAGVRWLAGVSRTPFTNDRATTGALPMFLAHVSVAVEVALTSNLFAVLVPAALSYSPPPAGLRDDIKSIIAIDVMIGIGYRI